MRAFGSGSTVNAVIAPNGTLTADHIVEDTSTGNHNIGQAVAVVSGSVYSISVYAKAPAQARQLQILVANANFTVTPAAIFNISTGSVVSSSNGTASIVPFGNGWYRCQFTTISATSSGSNGFNLRFYDGAANSYTGDDTSGLYLWGAQLEQSSYPTSYIPTSGSTATREADVSTSAATFGNSWYEQSEGTSYYQVVQAPQFVAFQAVASFTGTTTADEWRLWRTNTTVAQSLAVVNNSSTLSTALTYSPSSSGGYTFAGTIKANDAICASNGTLSVADTSGQVPTLSSLRIGARNNNAFYWNGHISRITYWDARVANEKLQSVTS